MRKNPIWVGILAAGMIVFVGRAFAQAPAVPGTVTPIGEMQIQPIRIAVPPSTSGRSSPSTSIEDLPLAKTTPIGSATPIGSTPTLASVSKATRPELQPGAVVKTFRTREVLPVEGRAEQHVLNGDAASAVYLFATELPLDQMASGEWGLMVKQLAFREVKNNNLDRARKIYQTYFERFAPYSEPLDYFAFPFELAQLAVIGQYDESNPVWHQTDTSRGSFKELRVGGFSDESLIQSLCKTYPRAMQLPYAVLQKVGTRPTVDDFRRASKWLQQPEIPQQARIALAAGMIRKWSVDQEDRPKRLKLLRSASDQSDQLFSRYALACLIKTLEPSEDPTENRLLADSYARWRGPLNHAHAERWIRAEFRAGNLDEGLRLHSRLVSMSFLPAEVAAEILLEVGATFQIEDPDRSLRMFREALQVADDAPSRAAALSGIGFCLQRNGEFQPAYDAFRQAATIYPQHILSSRMVALHAESQGDFSSALGAWKRLDFLPGQLRALHHLGRFEEARVLIEKELETMVPEAPPEPGILLQWARYVHGGKTPYTETQKVLNRLPTRLQFVTDSYLARLRYLNNNSPDWFWSRLSGVDLSHPAPSEGYLPGFASMTPEMRAATYQVLENRELLKSQARSGLNKIEVAPWAILILGMDGDASILEPARRCLNSSFQVSGWQLAAAGLVCLGTAEANDILDQWVQSPDEDPRRAAYRKTLLRQLRADRNGLKNFKPPADRPY